ncbi:MAG: acyltransferase [Butyrivibrio sp.]|nr:acyltransferase [Butyrivibrio sp.]
MGKSGLITYSKAVAILGVIIYHLCLGYLAVPSIVKTASGFGGAGVHIFIFCSGFGLMVSYIRKPLNFLDFIKRRFVKIYVPYIIVVLVAFCIPTLFPTARNRVLVLCSHVFLFKMFDPSLLDTFGGQFWYISTIIQFYLVFILLAKIMDKLGQKKYLIICCCISFLWALMIYLLGMNENRALTNFFLQYLWEFAMGMVIAREYSDTGLIRFEKIGFLPLLLIIIASFGIYSVMSFVGGPGKSFNDPFSFAAIFGIAILLYKLHFLTKFMEFTSKISYEMYLLHILVFKIFFIALKGLLPQYVMAILSIVCIYALSFLYNRFCSFILGRR